ncbi:receptor for retinol uptake stra6-like [Chanos chanos]|uniref:Receptor for retinol uptake STRA6 n=1 Tax=Chanos chanos TaxID=29144 RepID=A0A6J2ULR6_CHACN|nr:receptor for retinol uptake stra6-like [Chanos chanos]
MNSSSGSSGSSDSAPALFNYYDYSDWYDHLEPTEPPVEIVQPCDPTADDQLYHISIAAISLLIMLILVVFTKQKRLCQGFQRGSPSVLKAVNFLDQTEHQGLVLAVFGLVFCKLCVLVITPNPLPLTKDSTPATKELWKILAIFYYPALYYPLLVCGKLRSKLGYLLGSLLSWTHFAILCWQKIDCPKTPGIYKYYFLLNSLPQIACLAFLSFKYPLLLFKGSEGNGKTNTSEDLDSNYYKDYVKSILKKKPAKTSPSRTEKPSISDRISDTLKSYIYTPEKGFRLPLTVVISGVLSFIAVYQVCLLLICAVIPILHIVRAGINEDIAFLLLGFNIILHEDRQEVVKIVIHYTWCLEICYICAATLSCIVSLVMLMRSMVLHRVNLRGLYRGEIYNAYSCQRRIRPSQPGVVSWMGFVSYQTAVICLGMAVQTLVFFLGFVFVIFLVIIPILYGQNLMFFIVIGKLWPFWLMLFLVVAIQHVTAQFTFVKKDAGTRDLANRSGLFLLSYLLFLVNIVVGVLVGLWRMVVTALYNIVHLGRIDISLLNRGSELFDPGYRCYAHFLKLEVSQAHPVMKAFCGLLLHSTGQESSAGQKIRDAEEGIQLVQQEKKQSRASSARRARARWQLLLTLVNNPSLLGSRKHFQAQGTESIFNGSLNRAAKDGSKKSTGKASESTAAK